jgi:hypothetical protein
MSLWLPSKSQEPQASEFLSPIWMGLDLGGSVLMDSKRIGKLGLKTR